MAKAKTTTVATVTEEIFRSEVAGLGLSKSEIKTAEIMEKDAAAKKMELARATAA